jgi:large subunit ribosomal protein L4
MVMKVPVLNIKGEEVDAIELPAAIFEAPVNVGLMHQALVRQQANARLGTHKTQSRSEVSLSTRKIWRQKGTGRARHGSRKAPIFVGGGVAHGPRPRDYTVRMPRKMRQAALRSALTVKAQEGDLVVIDRLVLEQPKTREMIAVLDRLVGDASALVVLEDKNENVERSTNNIAGAKTLRANYLNIRDLLDYDKILMPLAALDLVTGWLGLGAGQGVEEESDAPS